MSVLWVVLGVAPLVCVICLTPVLYVRDRRRRKPPPVAVLESSEPRGRVQDVMRRK